MLRVLPVLFLAFLLSSPASSKSNPPSLSAANSQMEQLKQQIKADLKAEQNDQGDHDKLIEQYKGLADLEKRVEDVHQYVMYLGVAIALFGTLLTLVFVIVSFRTSIQARAEARQAAEKEVSIWLAKKGKETIQPLEDSLKKQGAEILGNIRQQGIEILDNLKTEADQHHQRVGVLEDKLQTFLNRVDSGSGGETEKVLDPKDVAELQRMIEQLRQKPEDQYSFDDWRALYVEAANRKALDEVTQYVEEIERIAADDLQKAKAKIGRAWLLGERQQYAEAVKLYDQIINQYGTSEDWRLIERVAVALFNKGLALINQNQREAAIAVYTDLVLRYGDRSEAGITEAVAKALYNKGCWLSQQGQWEAAIAVYDDIVSRYGDCSEVVIVEFVAKTQLNRAWALQKLNRTFEAKVAFAMLIERYASRTESVILALVEKAKKALNEVG